MQIAELFLSFGIKGTEKTLNAFSHIKTGIDNVTTTSLEAKAAILGTVYALEQLTSGAAKDGAHIENLASYLNISTKSLQQWNYAAQQANVSNQEFQSSLVSIQQKINAFNTSHNLPEGSNILSQQTGFDATKPFKATDVLENLLKLSQNKNYSKEKISTILSNWGLTQNEIGAAFAGKFNSGNLKNAPFYSNNEVKKLSDLNVEWSNLETKVKMFVGHLAAKDGGEAVKNFSKMADSAFKIANDFERIAHQLGAFKLIGESFKVWEQSLGFIADKLEGKKSNRDKELDAEQELDRWRLIQENQKRKKDLNENINHLRNLFESNSGSLLPAGKYIDLPTNPTNNIELNMNFQNDGREILPLKNDVQVAVVQACKMFTANTRTT